MDAIALVVTLCLDTAHHGTLCHEILTKHYGTIEACLAASDRDAAAWVTELKEVFGPDYRLADRRCERQSAPSAEVAGHD
jgi:hypothetical protein